jgi:hypothetical protein
MRTIGTVLTVCKGFEEGDTLAVYVGELKGYHSMYTLEDWRGDIIINAGTKFDHHHLKHLFNSTIQEVWVVEYADSDTVKRMERTSPQMELQLTRS